MVTADRSSSSQLLLLLTACLILPNKDCLILPNKALLLQGYI
jgi:hypothetical protein